MNTGDVQRGDCLLVSEGATLGECIYWDEDYPIVLGQRLFCLRANPDVLYPRYLYFYMTSFGFQSEVIARATGTSVPGLRQTEVLKLQIRLLPLQEQRAIGDTFYNLNKKIELNRRMNETLEAMARALFQSWFVDFDPVRAKAEGRDPGLPKPIADLFPDSFQDSELGEIPKGWRVSTIRELANDIQYGLTQSASLKRTGPHFLRITDIQGGKVDWGTVPFCKVTPEEHERYRLKPGDVLVARTGASTGENIYLPSVPDAVFASYLVRFQFSDLPTARLVGAFMRTPVYFEYVAGCIGGSAQPNASAQVLAGAQTVAPTPDIGRIFADFVAPLDRRIAANNEASRTLAAFRDALLPLLISGKFRVKNAEEMMDTSLEERR
jgi:type I restriction enzyme S subunit